MAVSTITYRQAATIIGSLSGKDRTIAIPVTYIDLTDGDHIAALFLAQVLYWTQYTKNEDGWFYKTAEEWYGEIRLTYRQISRVSKLLKPIGLETKLKKHDGTPKTFYRINFDIFIPIAVTFVNTGFSPFVKITKGEINITSKSILTKGEKPDFDKMSKSSISYSQEDTQEEPPQEAEPPNPVPQASPTQESGISEPKKYNQITEVGSRSDLAKHPVEEERDLKANILQSPQRSIAQHSGEGIAEQTSPQDPKTQNKPPLLEEKILGSDLLIPPNENDSRYQSEQAQQLDQQQAQQVANQFVNYDDRFTRGKQPPPGKAGFGPNDWDEGFVEWMRQEKSKTPYYAQTLKREAERGDVVKVLSRDSRTPEGREAIAASWETYKAIEAKKVQPAAEIIFIEPAIAPASPKKSLPKLNALERIKFMQAIANGTSIEEAYEALIKTRNTQQEIAS